MAGLSSAGAAQPRASPAICAIDRRRATTSTSLSIQSPIPRARKRVRFVTFSWHFLLIAVDDTSFTSVCSLDNWSPRPCVPRRRVRRTSHRPPSECPPQPSTTACPAAFSLEPPQRLYPTPCGGACPAPAKIVLRRAPPGSDIHVMLVKQFRVTVELHTGALTTPICRSVLLSAV